MPQIRFLIIIILLSFNACWQQAKAQNNLPSTIDPGRLIDTEDSRNLPDADKITLPSHSEALGTPIPPNADNIVISLNKIDVEGVTAFELSQISALYSELLGKEQKLSLLWVIADDITKLYRENGYFLSRAYVPAQENAEGHFKIKVVEGYIGDITFENNILNTRLSEKLASYLKYSKPVNIKTLETLLLQWNGIYGINVVGILRPDIGGPEGSVELFLQAEEEDGQALLSFDNYGSKYLGPYSGAASYRFSVWPGHQTTLAYSSSIPADEMHYGSISHAFQITPKWTVSASASWIKAEPGDNLSVNEIESGAQAQNIEIKYTPIRQIREKLSVSAKLERKNSDFDILEDTPLTRDRIRALRFGANYDFRSDNGALNNLDVTVSRGLDIMDASQEGDPLISRTGAKPDFTKIEASFSRQQVITDTIAVKAQAAGQWSSDSLYSSEEFGYGGPIYGRPYDTSEITGDKGIAASAELQYTGIQKTLDTLFIPYIYYDIGKVWNNDDASPDISAASSGFGIRLFNDRGIVADANAGFPLTKPIDNPLYGNGKNAVLRFGLSYQFNTPSPSFYKLFNREKPDPEPVFQADDEAVYQVDDEAVYDVSERETDPERAFKEADKIFDKQVKKAKNVK